MDGMFRFAPLLCLLGLAAMLGGCAMVHQKDREWLSDPVMQKQPDALEGSLNGDNFPRREGSSGGSSGAGGGCGC
ncbi:MAG TPA: DUF4266 domain-containing protein [Fibrobacteria bacterium]|nr:DUF4266 domain-containing protein [Fibrobacteria bacterium]